MILSVGSLGLWWPTIDPFLFCAHHDDAYPVGNEHMGPKASLAGRNLGQDFEGVDGWRMYHGRTVPGFPQHPHRGFETITLARRGYIDHFDSLGAKARFGHGDAQWMTAGSGIVHSEMFPLVQQDQPNPTELFQLWLNLPAEDKLVEPHFAMIWNDTIPRVTREGASFTVVAGLIHDAVPPTPPPRSWAARPDSDVAIWSVELKPGARCALPPAAITSNRTLYFFSGSSVSIAGRLFHEHAAVRVRPDVELVVENGHATAELLLLQGKPIGEPVAHHGPFVMNSRQELQQAISDYQRTQYGGWPWPSDGPVHPRSQGRFAQHADGRIEDRDP